ncbi:MAG TPA: FHA domain-containing protein [Abditibacterium sp.]|jgi:hypothetical protein
MLDALVVKYCPACDALNLPSESFCTACDFDLFAVPSEPRRDLLEAAPVASQNEITEAKADAPPLDSCRLELLDDPNVGFQIAPGQSVGRGIEADVLLLGVPHLGFISRRHAAFSKRGDQWFVQYVAQGNFVKVDGETYEDDSLVALHDGSVLTLSLTSFRFVLPSYSP